MWFSADFGNQIRFIGLATVGYTQYDRTAAVAVARTTVGVVEIGSGVYGVDVLPDTDTVEIQWDTGGSSPAFASQSLEDMAVSILRNRQETDPVTGIRTFYDNTDVALFTADIFEDVAGATPYQGDGINRTNRFT